jgi:glutamine synthetase
LYSKSKGSILPESLDEALDEMEKDTVIKEALGAHLFERFINAKRLEWEDYRLEVSAWELKKYLPSF